MTVITALLVIAVIILVHELGHFLVAKKVDIEVHEFSLGFGTKLLAFKKGETQYSLRILPLGGYVRMAGMVEEEEPNPRGFAAKSPGQKMAVTFAGPAMNFILAILIFIYTFTFVGTPQVVNNAVVGDVIEGRPAYEAGLRSGDRITSVNGVEVATWDAFTEQIREVAPGKPMEITLERKGQILELVVVPELDETRGISVIGVTAPVVFEKVGVWEGLKMGFYQTFEITWLIIVGLGQLITGAASTADLAGPVGITKMIGDAAAGGWVYLANFTAFS